MKKILFVLAACLVLLPDTADGKSGIWSRWKNLFTASDQDSVENTALSYLPLLLQDAQQAVLDTIRPVRILETLHPDREDLRSSGPSLPRPAPYVGSIPIEASVSPTARFTHNQNIVYPQMAEGLPIPTARAGDNIASLLATQNPVHSTSFSFMGQRMTSIWGNGAINDYYFLVIRF